MWILVWPEEYKVEYIFLNFLEFLEIMNFNLKLIEIVFFLYDRGFDNLFRIVKLLSYSY